MLTGDISNEGCGDERLETAVSDGTTGNPDASPRRDRPGGGILVGELAGQVLGDGLLVLPGQGNSLSIETDAGVVVLDVSGERHAPGMLDVLRRHTDRAVHAIVYSHGHNGYNAAVPVWQQHNADRGETPIRLIAQANLPRSNLIKQHHIYWS